MAFHLYVNGAHHSAPPRRPSSAVRKKTDESSNRIQTPAPYFSNATQPSKSRRHWTSTTQTKIKTEEGSLIADINSETSHTNKQITYRLVEKPVNVDQSWMPNWYKNADSNEDNSDFQQSLCK